MAVAGFIIGQTQAADELVLAGCQAGLIVYAARLIEQLVWHAAALQYGDVAGCGIQLFLCTQQLQGAELAVFIVHAAIRAQLDQAVAAVFCQAHHALFVDGVAALGAVAEHLHHPAILLWIGGWPNGQGSMLGHQPLDRLERNAGSRPGGGVTGRNHAGIAEAGLQARARLTIHHGYFMACFSQVPGAGYAKYSTAKDQHFHCFLTSATQCAVVRFFIVSRETLGWLSQPPPSGGCFSASGAALLSGHPWRSGSLVAGVTRVYNRAPYEPGCTGCMYDCEARAPRLVRLPHFMTATKR